MKVFVFNGSRHRANSVCCMWIDQFMQLLKMSAPESIEFLSHGMENIQFCSGCQECFKTGMYLCAACQGRPQVAEDAARCDTPPAEVHQHRPVCQRLQPRAGGERTVIL